MKKRIAMLLVLVMCLSLCACGSKSSGSAAKNNAPAPDADTADDSVGNVGIDPEMDAALAEKMKDDGVRELVKTYIDLSDYDTTLIDYDAACDVKFTSATVDGVELKFGMSYQDVLDAGYTPKHEGFGEQDSSQSFVQNDIFVSEDGVMVELGFFGAADGQPLSDGVLAYIGAVINDVSGGPYAEVSTDKIPLGMSIADVLDTLGQPNQLRQWALVDGTPVLGMEYGSGDKQLNLKVMIDPATETVAAITVLSTAA